MAMMEFSGELRVIDQVAGDCLLYALSLLSLS